MAHLQKFIDRFKAKASKAKQAQSRVKALARMEKIGPVLTSADFQFEFREPLSLPNPMLAFADVACGYRSPELGEKRIVDGIDRSVLAGQRIGILGANGQGKSTLVKTIVGALPPLAGAITAGKGLKIGYFAQQELDVLSPADGPLMHMVRLARDFGPPAREQELRDFLGSFRFVGEMVGAAGRHAVRRREGAAGAGDAGLAAAQPAAARRADQPPRPDDARGAERRPQRVRGHGDAGEPRPRPAARGLRRVLAGHQGRDRAVRRRPRRLPALAARAIEGRGEGSARGSVGTPGRDHGEDARRARNRRRPPQASDPPATAGNSREERKAAALARQQRSDAAKPLRQEVNRIDNKLGVLFAERDALEASLAEPEVDTAKLAETGKRLKAIVEQIERLEARWLELSTQLDEIAESVG